MPTLPFATYEQADARDAAFWAAARGAGWQEGNVTRRLYGVHTRQEPSEMDPDYVDPLPAGVDVGIVVPARDAHLDRLLIAELMTADEIAELVALYPDWQEGQSYIVDAFVAYGGSVYRCVQAHTNYDPSHTPDITKSLWANTAPAGVIAPWVQPTGAHDAYHLGDRVTYQGWIWECTATDAGGNNVWAPGVYGWTKVEPL